MNSHFRIITLMIIISWFLKFAFCFQSTCPGVSGCTCGKKHDFTVHYITCKNVQDMDFRRLPLNFGGSFKLYNTKLSNYSFLDPLRESKINSISILFSEIIGLFTWDWIPDSLEKLSITDTKIDFDAVQSYQKTCYIPRLQNFTYLSLSTMKLKFIPKCLPQNVNILRLDRLSHDNFTSGFPENVTVLKMNSNKFSEAMTKIFDKLKTSIRVLWLTYQKFEDGKWPFGFPPENLEKLLMLKANISKIPAEVLKPFHKADKLRLLALQYNKLKSVPSGLPPHLKMLKLSSNLIEYIDPYVWKGLVNLTYVDLSRNSLTMVPIGMPSSLMSVHLANNIIAYSPQEALLNLAHLEILDLSYNRLTAMPKGIRSSAFKHYAINNNRISYVRGPDEYTFCDNCSQMIIGNNPWTCDRNMLDLLIWMNEKMKKYDDPKGMTQLGLPIYAECSNSPIEGFDDSLLARILEYSQYIKYPPNDKCQYTVEELVCVDDGIKKVPNKLPSGLVEIRFTNNSELSFVPDYYLWNQSNLHTLKLDHDNLTEVPYGLPTNLVTLSLQYNKIAEITLRSTRALRNITGLRFLYLDGNLLKSIQPSTFADILRLKWIGLRENPLHCDCSFWPTTNWLNSFLREKIGSKPVLYQSVAMCASPTQVKGRLVSYLWGHYSYRLKCVPSFCHVVDATTDAVMKPIVNCSLFVPTLGLPTDNRTLGKFPYFGASNFWKVLDLSGLLLTMNNFSLKHLPNLETLILTNNSLTEMPYLLPPKIKILNLSYNNIRTFNSNIKQILPDLKELDLRYNDIKMLWKTDIHVFSFLDRLNLMDNPIACNCSLQSLVRWSQAYKNNPDSIKNYHSKDITCVDENLQRLRIFYLKEEKYCPGFPLTLILSCVAALILIVIFVVVIINIYLHKTRKSKQQNYILQGFKKLLEKENQTLPDPETGILLNNFSYDAFVSYAASDKDLEFVIRMIEDKYIFDDSLKPVTSRTPKEFILAIFQELEDSGKYKLCLHERDFTPGLGITDNIVNAINSSRHIILLLSNNFVESMWCQYEVQMSLVELHRRRRSKLLLAILLEDITKQSSFQGNLKNFLDVIDCVNIPYTESSENYESFWNVIKNFISK